MAKVNVGCDIYLYLKKKKDIQAFSAVKWLGKYYYASPIKYMAIPNNQWE